MRWPMLCWPGRKCRVTWPPCRGYRDRQRLDQKLTVGFSDQVTRLFGSAQPLVALGRNMGLLGLDLLPPAKRWFARQAMGLGTRPDA